MAKRKLTLANNPLLSGPALADREVAGVPYRDIPIASIDRDPNQPRVSFDEEKLSELASSIKRYGVLTPILVKPGKESGRYTLISGERRHRASERAGLSSIPAIIDSRDDASGETTLAIQLVENIQRADLSPLERAHAIGALKEAHKLSIRDVADRLGVSKSMVQRSLEILDLPDDLLNALREGAAESKVLLLAKIEDEEIRSSYLRELDTLTRKQLKRDVDKSKEPKSEEKRPTTSFLSPDDIRISEELQRALGLKVRMTRPASDSERGKLVIEFYSQDDLQEVFRKLVSNG